MRRWLEILLAAFLAVSCGTARYARGMESSDIETIVPADGIIQPVEYPSGERRLDHRRMVVYLPADYYADTARRYPVMYLLHGARGNEVTWMEKQRGDAIHSKDSLVSAGLTEDFILVMPNINCYFSDKEYNNGHAINAFRAFWIVDGEAEVHFVEDVVDFVDARFRTIPEKQARSIAGMSTGGMQALYLSANHPDVFGNVGLFSAYSANTFAGLRHPEFYLGLSRKLRAQFAQAPDNYVIMIGHADIFYPNMCCYSRRLTRHGYKHSFIDYPGGHAWYNWRVFFVRFCQEVYGKEGAE